MTTVRCIDRSAKDEPRPTTFVPIDSRAAVTVRIQDDQARLAWESDVPAHHRATGHLERFVKEIVSRLGPKDHLLIIGPGTLRLHLKRHHSQFNGHRPGVQDFPCGPWQPLSERQLIAPSTGSLASNRASDRVGAYHWTQPSADRRSGQMRPPRRVVNKPPREAGPQAPEY